MASTSPHAVVFLWVLQHCSLPTIVALAQVNHRIRFCVQAWFRARTIAATAHSTSGNIADARALVNLTATTRAAIVGSTALSVLTVDAPISDMAALLPDLNIVIPEENLCEWKLLLEGALGYQLCVLL